MYDEHNVKKAIGHALDTFYKTLIDKLNTIDIDLIMRRKNPYLYRAKAMHSATDIVGSVLFAFISSSEETIFGNCFFEPIAIAASGGEKALAEGLDLIIYNHSDNSVTAIAVKSGTSVYNADSKKRQEQNFIAASKLATQAKQRYEAIIGYSYGKKRLSTRGMPRIYQELAGQAFWERITGDSNFYKKLIGYMEDMPEHYALLFNEAYQKAENRMVRDFANKFCTTDGSINWDKLLEFNSGK
ncbi:hypothetical protein AB840_05950 [Megasphaera cerevisiae DSM 20462]|uniref:Type II restriction endonuclease EcoO109IR domain-containing protein n=1 Tax=Megasphaera cerevisiae DSM 20462 TaxID=1122219 RepID=A0A0J6WTJ4_9FIRM|nr:PmeII family type II restriction endonuclease [Megasphaera cerevisiae]KMO86860.1 hypothetical protein AB840_05950 [Megasphaera cerevisiae DSM 20462]SJZ83983.1 Type II restriction endonuclease EcoO109I [Megasphaera cerevisiae DSM 20462]